MAPGAPADPLAAVADSAQRGRLTVLAGAGISMLAPSTLPSWSDFTGALLEEAVALAATATFLDAEARAGIARLSAKSISTGTLSEAISKYVASVGYFPVLTALDGTETNANHQALAMLAERGALGAIITPNFDTLIERAFRERGVPLAEPDAPPVPGATCTLVRLHGVATSVKTMVDTVGQKARGLSFEIHQRLQRALHQQHVLVVGFSGTDLDFAADYLSLESVDVAGITWIVRAGSASPPQAVALRARLGDRLQLVEGSLPALWRDLGVNIPAGEVAAEADQAANARLRVRAHVRGMYEKLGAPLAVSLCMRLLDDSGLRASAVHVYSALARFADTWVNPDSSQQLTVLRALSSTQGLASSAEMLAWQQKDVDCCARNLARWRAESNQTRDLISTRQAAHLGTPLPFPFEGVLDEQGWRALHRTVEDELHFLQAIGWGNLAMSYASMARLNEANQAMWKAIDYSLLATDLRSLAVAWFANGIIELQADAPLSATLWSLLRAECAGVAGGNVDNALAAVITRAQLLMHGGEYDLATRCLERATQRAAMTAKRGHKVHALVVRAMLAARRRELLESLQLFDEAISESSTMPELTALAKWRRLETSCHEPPLRRTLLSDCDYLEQFVGSRGSTGDGALGIPSLDVIRSMRAHIIETTEFRPPPFVVMDDRLEGMDGPVKLRQLLVNSEYFGDERSVAAILRQLTEQKLQDGTDNPRAEELATAYARVAGGDVQSQVNARLLFSIAAYRLGDMERATQAMAGLENIELAFDHDLEQKKRAWIARLRQGGSQPMHPYLLVRNIADGLPALRFPASDRMRIAASLVEVNAPVAHILLCQLAHEFRDTSDANGLATCYQLLAKWASAAGRKPLVAELTSIAQEYAARAQVKDIRR